MQLEPGLINHLYSLLITFNLDLNIVEVISIYKGHKLHLCKEESGELKAYYSTKDEEFYFKFDNELGWVEI